MESRQGRRLGMPWWCWAISAVAAAVILPAAAIMLDSRDATREEFLAEPRVDLANAKRIAVNQFEIDDAAGGQELLARTYDVEDLFTRLISERNETAGAAREHLAAIVQSSAPGPWENSNGDDAAKRSLGWMEEGLVVRQTAAGHERIVRQLAALRQHGFAELTVEVRILSGPVAAIDQIAAKWKLIGATAEDEWGTESQPLVNHKSPAADAVEGAEQIRGTVETLIEKQVPALVAFLDQEETRLVVELAQNNATTNIVQAPKVVVFNGQSARIADNTQRPFVVGVKPTLNGGAEPQVRVVSEGTTIRLRPELTSDDSVQLDLSLMLSHIRGVETAEFGNGPDSVIVQVPEVGMTKLKSTVNMKLDQTLAISLPSATVGNKFKGGCVLVNVFKSPIESRQAGGPRKIDYAVAQASHRQPVASDQPAKAGASSSPLIEKLYPVADLVVPIPGDPMVVYLLGAKPAAPRFNSTTPDFDSLIELLTATVARKSWKQNGGEGTIATQMNRYSLLISNTEEAHVQVANCLESLHRMQDTQICWGTEIFTTKQSEFARWASGRNDESLAKLASSRGRLTVLSPEAVQSLNDKVASKEAVVSSKDRIHSLKITGFIGQSPDFRFPAGADSGMNLISRAQFQATMSSNLRTMRMMLGIHATDAGNADLGEPAWSEPFNLPRGHSVLFDLEPELKREGNASAATTQRRLFLLTPNVLIASNEEYLRTLSPVAGE